MKKEHIIYLESIGITGPLLPKVNLVYEYYNQYLGYDIDDIFVSEYINSDGTRTYENLWFFNENYCYEAKQFLTMDDFDTDLISNSIDSFTVRKTDFDIKNNVTTESSRMNLDFLLKVDRTGQMKASKDNCKKMSEILLKYIKPNLIK